MLNLIITRIIFEFLLELLLVPFRILSPIFSSPRVWPVRISIPFYSQLPAHLQEFSAFLCFVYRSSRSFLGEVAIEISFEQVIFHYLSLITIFCSIFLEQLK